MSKKICQLMENILNNPGWEEKLIAELCIEDCENCPYNAVSARDKMRDILMIICDRLEEKRLKEAKLEFIAYVMNVSLEKTNQELEESNLLDFFGLLQKKDHYQEEFKEAVTIFEKNFWGQMEKITYETIKAIKEA